MERNALNNNRLLAGVILAGILLSGLILRISYLREIVNNPDFSFPQVDACYHDYWARGIVTGDWTNLQHLNYGNDPEICVRPYFRPPGYPFFLAFIYYLSGGSYLAARIVQMGLGLLNCVLAYFLGRTLFNRAVGVIFAAFMSVYWVFIYFEGELLAPVLLVTLSLSLMHVLCLLRDKITFWRAFAGGAILGVFALVRPNALLFGPVVLAWLWWLARRRNDGRHIGVTGLGFVLAAVMVIAPATIRNYIVAHDFVIITSNVGINLYIGNNEKSDGFSPGIPDLKEIAGLDRWTSADYPRIVRGFEEVLGKKMKYSEASSYFAKKAIKYIKQHPVKTLKLMAIKTALFWGPAEVSNNKEIYYEKQSSPTLCHIPGFPIAISFAIVGLIQLFIARKERHGQDEAIPLVTQRQFEISMLVLLFIVTYFISFLPFFVAGRYRVPIIPFLFLFGAYGLYRIGQQVVSRNSYGFVWAGISVVLYIAVSISFVPYKPDLSQWHIARASCYRRAKQFALAIEEYRETIRLKPDHAGAHNNLGFVLQSQGKLDEALSHFRQALQIEPDYALAHNNLGLALQSQGKLDEAISHFCQALQIKPDLAQAHNNLGLALQSQGKLDEAITHFIKVVQLDPDSVNAHYVLAYALKDGGRTKETIAEFKETLRLRPDWIIPMNSFAWLLATHKDNEFRNPEEAIRLSERACELTNYERPDLLDTLAAAYAAAGRFSDAAATAEKALKLIDPAGNIERAQNIQNRLQLYKRSQPYYDSDQ